MSEFVLDFFEGKNLATIEKKKHSYLMIDGHDQADIYILDTFNKLGYKAEINNYTASRVN